MTDTAGHTPTRLTVARSVSSSGHTKISIVSSGVGQVGVEEIARVYGDHAEDHAAFIVKAVNAHDALLEMLKKDAARFAHIRERLAIWNDLSGTRRAEVIDWVWQAECETRDAAHARRPTDGEKR